MVMGSIPVGHCYYYVHGGRSSFAGPYNFILLYKFFFHKTEHCFIRNSKNNIINIVVVTPGTKFTPIRIMHNCSVITIHNF